MRIFYILSAYISHRQAGLEYIACLKKLGHEVICNYPEFLSGKAEAVTLAERRSYEFAFDMGMMESAREADLIILHEDPAWHDKIFELLPWMSEKRLVIYLPWENAKLPEAFVRPLQRAQVIWTCSDFCRRAFFEYFSNVEVLPHLVRRPQPGKEALGWVQELLSSHGVINEKIFLSVVDGLNPRKNLEGLLTAFNLFRQASRIPARLLIKQYRVAMPLDGQPRVINITDMLDDAHVAALYASCTAYVSAHRTEGWGLGLSTAMSFGKVAIATAYSGNLEFMDAGNSLLIPYTLEHVSCQMEMKIPLFTTKMLWAEPDLLALAEAMRRVAEERLDPDLARNAAQITHRFGPQAIEVRLEELLAKLK